MAFLGIESGFRWIFFSIANTQWHLPSRFLSCQILFFVVDFLCLFCFFAWWNTKLPAKDIFFFFHFFWHGECLHFQHVQDIKIDFLMVLKFHFWRHYLTILRNKKFILTAEYRPIVRRPSFHCSIRNCIERLSIKPFGTITCYGQWLCEVAVNRAIGTQFQSIQWILFIQHKNKTNPLMNRIAALTHSYYDDVEQFLFMKSNDFPSFWFHLLSCLVISRSLLLVYRYRTGLKMERGIHEFHCTFAKEIFFVKLDRFNKYGEHSLNECVTLTKTRKVFNWNVFWMEYNENYHQIQRFILNADHFLWHSV